MRSALVLACLLGVLPGLNGCYTQLKSMPANPTPSGPPQNPHRPIPWVSPPPGLSFSLSVDPAVFDLGDSVTLTIVVSNEGGTPFEERFAEGCNIDFDIYSDWGERMGPYRGCNCFFSVVRLEPGERRVTTRRWGADYFNAPRDLAPGVYWVTAGFVRRQLQLTPMMEPVRIEISR